MSDSQQDRERGATSAGRLDEGETSIDSPKRMHNARAVQPPLARSTRSIDHPGGFSQEAAGNIAIPKFMLCDICSEHEAVKTCLTCTMSYCETHIRTHYTKPNLQKHNLVDVTKDPHQDNIDRDQRQHITTEIPSPKELTVDSVEISSASLSWSPPDEMDQMPHQYQVSYRCSGEELTRTTTSLNISLSGLQPATDYCVSVWTLLKNGMKSQPVSSTFKTESFIKQLSEMGLQNHYENKLTLSKVLEISTDTISDESHMSLAAMFLKKLMMSNVNARSVKCASTDNRNINPLDLITAMFLCSDGLLQQEIVLKMSMCQFAVPLLLPNFETNQITMMLWALRDIVKRFRPSSETATNSFVEERVVASKLPMVSFVKLGESEVSKSHILNKLISNPQQYHDTFVHYDMDCCDVPRTISRGLVEISWYLPCGNRSTDIFNQPLAVANLRGDIRSFNKQFSFLCQSSAAVYIFSHDSNKEVFDALKMTGLHIGGKQLSTELFFVITSQRKMYKIDTVGQVFNDYCNDCASSKTVRKKQNDAEFVKTLQSSVVKIIEKDHNKRTIENMADIARDCMIIVDEDIKECQEARQMADYITSSIAGQTSNSVDIVKFKTEELPLQGQVWKELSRLQKERCKLKKSGDMDIQHYISSLKKREKDLRKEQESYEIKPAMVNFLHGMSMEASSRSYFLKWLRMKLDNLSREKLADVREQYKELCRSSPGEKDKIVALDEHISDCSLGLEHFLRELSQLYESVYNLPIDCPQRQQMEHLPGLCAQMLLEGLPIEIVDGNASNIPLQWISDVLSELHELVGSKSRIRVVTVLGVQSTGKSTLLNTMFGVQFAVSSGRCTRGAFMLLLGVGKDLKDELECDFIVVIDTEGLKSPELALLEDSYEHDNELATLVIGLSDVTIINIAMENSTEMKDILQIVVHAFIRMKEVGKRPVCHFVHQNVSDMAAYDNNMRDRKKLLEQLNEMTVAAAKMEKRENITKFTDVMQYNPDTNSCYIPGLWHGTPPMAPVNAGYSEAVYTFKKTLIHILKGYKRNDDLTKLQEWIKCLWDAVKFENFIFSFQNSLVADAYTKLCIVYNSWAWSFQKEMQNWTVKAVTEIANFEEPDQKKNNNSDNSIINMKQTLLNEAIDKLSTGEKTMQDNLEKYFDSKGGHTNLVEKYRQGFVSSIMGLRSDTAKVVNRDLEAAVEIKKGKSKLEKIRSSQASTIENKVLELLQNCREKQFELSEQDLKAEFERMWEVTLSEISFSDLHRRNVAADTQVALKDNLSMKGGKVTKLLTTANLEDYGKAPFEVSSGLFGKFFYGKHTRTVKHICKETIKVSEELIGTIINSQTDYRETHTIDLIKTIDQECTKMQRDLNCHIDEESEALLKLHICGKAVRDFQAMHDRYIEVNDPRKCLNQSKDKYFSDFIDLFHDRDQCQKKAEEFTKKCLQPAVMDYVTKRIGPDIVDEMRTGEGSEDYSTRMAFQFNILEQLLHDHTYDGYEQYINNYESFVKDWLLGKITDKLSLENTLKALEIKHLSEVIKVINKSILQDRSTCTVNDIKSSIDNISNDLKSDLEIPKDALDSVKRLINSTHKEGFVKYLTEFVKEMEKSLAAQYEKGWSIPDRLRSLPFKPQDQMFKDLFGCGKQCPFCGAPCEAGGTGHSKHFSTIHRPQGLFSWRNATSKLLVTDICTSSVVSGQRFRVPGTEAEYHPYKDYQKYYPDWSIPGDASFQATDYWKYVMKTFNKTIADATHALPADIPGDWETLTTDDAMKSLNTSFNMK